MLRIKLLAAVVSLFVALAEEFYLFSEETADTNKTEITTVAKDNKDTLIVVAPEKTEATPVQTITVSASIYFPEPRQTDSTPFITADGSRINKQNPGEHRWIAVSRDLHSRWGGSISYGDSLMISGISKELDGLYVVRDVMNRRMRNRIDILVGANDNIMGMWNDVEVAILQ